MPIEKESTTGTSSCVPSDNLKMVTWGEFVKDIPKEQPKAVMMFVNKPPEVVKSNYVPEMVTWGRTVAYLPYGPMGEQIVDLVSMPKVDTSNSSLKHIGAIYYEGVDGYYIAGEDGNYQQFTDFLIKIEAKECIFTAGGKEAEVYNITLTNDQGDVKKLRIPSEEWCNLLTKIEKQARSCLVFSDEVSRYREKFARLSGLILKQSAYPTHIVRKCWGWGEPEENGSRIFYHGGRADCLSDKALLPHICQMDKRKACLKKGWQIFDVGPACVMVPMVLYSLASYMDAIFTDAGYPLASCLMLIGGSGFLKTSSAKVVFSPARFPVEKRIFSVRGTNAVFNVLHECAFDDTLVVDDFNLEGSKADAQHKEKVLRDLIRAYADKSPRAKYGGNDDVKQYAIRGGCVFTGETRMTGQLKSSELRYLKVILKSRLDGEKLAFFQDDPNIWLGFCSEFIYYLESHYLELRSLVVRTFRTGRTAALPLEARLVDMYLHLAIVAEVLMRFMSDSLAIRADESETWLTDAKSVLLALITKQEEDAKVREPHIQYLSEVWNLMGTGAVKIASNLEEFLGNTASFIGYASDEVFMLKKDDTFKAVREAFWSRGESFPMAADDLSKALKAHGLSKCDSGSCLKKAPSKINLKSRRFFTLRQELSNIKGSRRFSVGL